jgi:hypothetical protein
MPLSSSALPSLLFCLAHLRVASCHLGSATGQLGGFQVHHEISHLLLKILQQQDRGSRC